MEIRVSVEESGEVSRSIHIEIPRSLYDKKFSAAVSQAQGQARIKGFRQGKAPKDLIQKLYGGQIQDEILRDLISGAFEDVVKDHKLRVVGSPHVHIDPLEEGKDVKAKADVALFPEPTIEHYSGLTIEVDEAEVNPDDLEKQLNEIRRNFSSEVPVNDRTTVQAGDIAYIDYTGAVDGEERNELCGSDETLELAEGSAPESFITALVGLDIGQSTSVDLEMSKDHKDEKLRGKTATYQVTVKKISTRELPALDDELAKKTGIAQTLEELKAKINEHLEKTIKRDNRKKREDALVDQLIEKNSFEVPATMVESEIRSMLFEFGALDPSKEESFRLSVESFTPSLGPAAERRIRRDIIVDRIVTQTGLSVDDEGLENWLDAQATEAQVPREKFFQEIGYPRNKENIRRLAARAIMLDSLMEQSAVKQKKAKKAKKHN